MVATTASSKFPISERVAKMKASSTLAAMQAAEAMRAEGIDVVISARVNRISTRLRTSKTLPSPR